MRGLWISLLFFFFLGHPTGLQIGKDYLAEEKEAVKEETPEETMERERLEKEKKEKEEAEKKAKGSTTEYF